jgi:hypothetical protein
MSNLLHAIAWEKPVAVSADLPHLRISDDDIRLPPGKTLENDWEILWTDVGGEG